MSVAAVAAPAGERAGTLRLGIAAIVFYAIHATELFLRFPAVDLLWSCNVASALIAAGLLVGAARPVAIGASMLVIGNVFWVIALATGEEFLVTSLFTHVGALVLALAGLRRLGLPRHAWWQTVAVVAAITLAARFAGHPEENVNLAHRIPPGFEGPFPSHGAYILFLTACWSAGALALDRVLRAAGYREPGRA